MKTTIWLAIVARISFLQFPVGVSAARPSNSFDNASATSVSIAADSSKGLLQLQRSESKAEPWCADKKADNERLCCTTKHDDGTPVTVNKDYGTQIEAVGCNSCWCGETEDSLYWKVYEGRFGCNLHLASMTGTKFTYESAWNKVIRAIQRQKLIDLKELLMCVSFPGVKLTEGQLLHGVREAAGNTPEGQNLYWRQAGSPDTTECAGTYYRIDTRRQPKPFTKVDEEVLWNLVMDNQVKWPTDDATIDQKWAAAAACVWDPLMDLNKRDDQVDPEKLKTRERALFGIAERKHPRMEWKSVGDTCEYDVIKNLGKRPHQEVQFPKDLWKIVEEDGSATYQQLFDCIYQRRGNGEVEVDVIPYVDAAELGDDVRRSTLQGRLGESRWKNEDSEDGDLLSEEGFSLHNRKYALKNKPVTMDDLQAALVHALHLKKFNQKEAFELVKDSRAVNEDDEVNEHCKEGFGEALKQVYKWHFQTDELLWVWRGDERKPDVLSKKFMGGENWRKAPEWDPLVFRGLFEDIGVPKHGQLVNPKQIERLLVYLQQYFVSRKKNPLDATEAEKEAVENILSGIRGSGAQTHYIRKYLSDRASVLAAEFNLMGDHYKWWNDVEWPGSVPEKARQIMKQGKVVTKSDVLTLLHYLPMDTIKKHVANQLTYLARSLIEDHEVVWTGLPLTIVDDDLLPGEDEDSKNRAKESFEQSFKTLRQARYKEAHPAVSVNDTTEIDWSKMKGKKVSVEDWEKLINGDFSSNPAMVSYHFDNWLRAHTQLNHDENNIIKEPFIATPAVYQATWQEDKNLMDAFENEYRWATSFEKSNDYKRREPLLDILDPLSPPSPLKIKRPVRRAKVLPMQLQALCYSPPQAANLGLIVPANTYPLLTPGPYVWTTDTRVTNYIDPDTGEVHEREPFPAIKLLNMYVREWFSRPKERRDTDDPMPPIPGEEVFLDQAVTIVHSDQDVLLSEINHKILMPHDLELTGYIKVQRPVTPSIPDAVAAVANRNAKNGLMLRKNMYHSDEEGDKHVQYRNELQAQFKAIEEFQKRPEKDEYFIDLGHPYKRFGKVVDDSSIGIDGNVKVEFESDDPNAAWTSQDVNIASQAVKTWVPARVLSKTKYMALHVKTNDHEELAGQRFRRGRIKYMIWTRDRTKLNLETSDIATWLRENVGFEERVFGVYLVANREQTGAYKDSEDPDDNKPDDYLVLKANQFDVMLRPSLESHQLHADQQLKNLDEMVGAGGRNQPFDEAIHLEYLRMFKEMHPDNYLPDNEITKADVIDESGTELLTSIIDPKQMGIGVLAQRQEVMLTGPTGYDGYLAEISAKDVDVPMCSEWGRPRPFELHDASPEHYPGNAHAIGTPPYYCTDKVLWYHVTIIASGEGELQDPRCGGWVSIWEIMPVADTHNDRRGETLEGLDRIGQAVKIRDDADLSNAVRITETTPMRLGRSEWNLIQGRTGSIQLAKKADPIKKLRKATTEEIARNDPEIIPRKGELGVEELLKEEDIERTSPQFFWHYTVLLTPKPVDPEDFHYQYRWTETGAKKFPEELPYEAGLCLPEPASGPLTPTLVPDSAGVYPLLSKDCADVLVQGILGKDAYSKERLPFGIDSLVKPPGTKKEEALHWLIKEKVSYDWGEKAVAFYTQHFPEGFKFLKGIGEVPPDEVVGVSKKVTAKQTEELLKKFNLEDMRAINDHYHLDFAAQAPVPVDPETKNEMIGDLVSGDMEPEMLSSLRHKLERLREHTDMLKNEVNEMQREKLKRESSGSTLSASDLKKYEQIVWDHRMDKWPKQDDMNAAVRRDEEVNGMETAGKRLEKMRQMYSALIPDVAKARILSGADLPANGIKHNIKELGHHGLNFLGSAIGSSKLGDHLIKFLRSAHKATRTNGTKYRGDNDEDKTDSLYEEDQVSKYADELRHTGEEDWGDFGPWQQRPEAGKETVLSDSWPNLEPWKP